MFKKILLGLVVVVVGLCAFAATRPDAFHIERSGDVPSAEAAYAYVNDFHKWIDWSPWEKLDPSMKKTYSGPASGVGSEYAWEGNDKVGSGKMTILESSPEKIVLQLEFLKPWKAVNQTTFRFSGNRVTWMMDGKSNFVAKLMSIVMSMDKMVGPDFERGLSSLAQAAKK